MSAALFYMLYFMIGITYALINQYVRKMEATDTWYMAWIGLWPFFFICLIIIGMQKIITKIKTHL